MKSFTQKVAFMLAVSVAPGIMTSADAGIPVIDATNLSQTTVAAIENVAQTLKQIEQYRTQLQQYENQLRNTLAPAVYIWDQAQATINGLMNAIDTLNYYKNKVGSLDAYLSKFQDVAYYRNSPCYTSAGCSDAEREAISENRRFASESQKKANDALFRGLDRQQDSLKIDALTLEQLQDSAQGATGQMQAIQYANQLASQQANQLLQIRALLIAQQNAIATRMQAEADQEASTQAADEQAMKGGYTHSMRKAY